MMHGKVVKRGVEAGRGEVWKAGPSGVKWGDDKSDRGSGRVSLRAWQCQGIFLEFTLPLCKYRIFVVWLC